MFYYYFQEISKINFADILTRVKKYLEKQDVQAKSIPFPHILCKRIAVGKTFGIFLCSSGTNGLVTDDIENSQHTVSSNSKTVENLFGILLFKPDFTQMLGAIVLLRYVQVLK